MCRVVRKPLTRPERFRFRLGCLAFRLRAKAELAIPVLRGTLVLRVMAVTGAAEALPLFGTLSAALQLIRRITEQAAQADISPEVPDLQETPALLVMLALLQLGLPTLFPVELAELEARLVAGAAGATQVNAEAPQRIAILTLNKTGLRPAAPLAIQLRVKP